MHSQFVRTSETCSGALPVFVYLNTAFTRVSLFWMKVPPLNARLSNFILGAGLPAAAIHAAKNNIAAAAFAIGLPHHLERSSIYIHHIYAFWQVRYGYAFVWHNDFVHNHAAFDVE
jgi:hypothetical protein